MPRLSNDHRWGIIVGVLALLLIAAPAANANPVTDVWDWGTGLLGDAATGVAGDGIRALTSWVADGAGWLAKACFSAMSATSDPRPGEGWFTSSYQRMTLIGAAFAAPCLVLGLVQALIHQDTRMLGRVVAAIPGSALLTGAAVATTRMLLAATDQISLWLVQASGHDIGAYGTHMALRLMASPGTSAFVVFLVATVTAISGLVLWIELLVRAALVYVLLGFFPLMAAMMIWPAAAGGIRRLIRLLVAVILSKVVIVGVVAMGVAAATQSGISDRFEGLLVGTAMTTIACFAPMAIHRLLPILEESVSVRGNLSGGGATRTATHAHGTFSAAQAVSRDLRAMRGATTGGVGAAAAATRPAARPSGTRPSRPSGSAGMPIAGTGR